MAIEEIDAYELEMYDVAEPTLLGAERNYVIGICGAPAVVASMYAWFPTPWWCFIAAAAIFMVGLAILQFAYHLDPQMSKTLPRFLAYPKFIPAHDSLGACPRKRQRMLEKRRKDRFNR